MLFIDENIFAFDFCKLIVLEAFCVLDNGDNFLSDKFLDFNKGLFFFDFSCARVPQSSRCAGGGGEHSNE